MTFRPDIFLALGAGAFCGPSAPSGSVVLTSVEALDVVEEAAVLRAVRRVGGPVPGVDEVLRLHLGTVVELRALLDLDRVDLGVGGVDRLGQRVLRRTTVVRVLDQAGPQPVDDLATAGLGGVRRDQRVLGLAAVTVIAPLALSPAVVAVRHRSAAGRDERDSRAQRDSARRPLRDSHSEGPPLSNQVPSWVSRTLGVTPPRPAPLPARRDRREIGTPLMFRSAGLTYTTGPTRRRVTATDRLIAGSRSTGCRTGCSRTGGEVLPL